MPTKEEEKKKKWKPVTDDIRSKKKKKEQDVQNTETLKYGEKVPEMVGSFNIKNSTAS